MAGQQFRWRLIKRVIYAAFAIAVVFLCLLELLVPDWNKGADPIPARYPLDS
jgi:hypothetical protein